MSSFSSSCQGLGEAMLVELVEIYIINATTTVVVPRSIKATSSSLAGSRSGRLHRAVCVDTAEVLLVRRFVGLDLRGAVMITLL